MTMTIIEFLNARIAEDEAAESRKRRVDVEKMNEDFGECSIEYIGPDKVMISGQDVSYCMYSFEFHAQYSEPAPDKRMLAECAAKRSILERRRTIDLSANESEWAMGVSDANYEAIVALAAVYKDHPDYRDEWSEWRL